MTPLEEVLKSLRSIKCANDSNVTKDTYCDFEAVGFLKDESMRLSIPMIADMIADIDGISKKDRDSGNMAKDDVVFVFESDAVTVHNAVHVMNKVDTNYSLLMWRPGTYAQMKCKAMVEDGVQPLIVCKPMNEKEAE